MTKRSYNPCLAKTHHCYKVGEVATLYGIHKNTGLIWKKKGLLTIDNLKPFLIKGVELRKFLEVRRSKSKCKCQVDEIYCVNCRTPKKPADNRADYIPPIRGDLGSIVGLCPDCGILIYRRTSTKRLELIRRYIDITLPMAN